MHTTKTDAVGNWALWFHLAFCILSFQFYHLASVRMQELCRHLNLRDMELKRKIWTCFEHTIIHCIDLMQDRHLDQILMCSVYVICKVSICISCINDADICRPYSCTDEIVYSRCLAHMLACFWLLWYIVFFFSVACLCTCRINPFHLFIAGPHIFQVIVD